MFTEDSQITKMSSEYNGNSKDNKNQEHTYTTVLANMTQK